MSVSSPSFSPERLLEAVASIPESSAWWVGFSGGADSTALLHALWQISPKLNNAVRALHVNHGLDASSDQWQSHCERFCKQRNIPLTCRRVQIEQTPREGLEAAAREQRYAAAQSVMAPGDVLLVAHHADDQAETVLLHLLRGSGVDGLAGAHTLRPLGEGWLARPLLNETRNSLRAWVESEGLGWIEDPSNEDESRDRNWLRARVLPALESRFPNVVSRLSRSAAHARDAADYLQHRADQLLASGEDRSGTLSVEILNGQPEFLRRVILRRWLQSRNTPSIPERQMREFSRQLAAPTLSGSAEVKWSGWTLRLHRGQLWLNYGDEPGPCPEIAWENVGSLDLGAVFGILEIQPAGSLPLAGLVTGHLRDGERIQLSANGPHREIRRLMQDQGVPPWLRQAIPVLRHEGELVAIADAFVQAGFEQKLKDFGLQLKWTPGDPVLQLVAEQLRAAC